MRLYILISSVFTRQRWGFAVRSGILDADCLVLHLESESRVLKATLLVDCVGCSDRESGSDPTFRRRRGKDGERPPARANEAVICNGPLWGILP